MKTNDNVNTLFLIGINYKSAALELRERLHFQKRELETALVAICRLDGINEAMILSTCNRLEILIAGDDAMPILNWLAETRHLSIATLTTHHYCHQGEAAIGHLLRVATGLDSMLTGETQIFGQLKSAYAVANAGGHIGERLSSLMPALFTATKAIRTESGIGMHATSFSHLISKQAKNLFGQLVDKQVLLIGSGEMIEQAGVYLHELTDQPLLIANRTIERGVQLAEKLGGKAISLSDITYHLPKADIVVTATSATLPLLGKGRVEGMIEARSNRPLLMIDLALPRDIEPEVGNLAEVYLYNLDDLNALRSKQEQERDASAKLAEAMLPEQINIIKQQLQEHACTAVLKAYRKQSEQICSSELAQAKLALAEGTDPETILEKLAHRLTQKLLHTPSIKLGEIDTHKDEKVAHLAKRILLED